MVILSSLFFLCIYTFSYKHLYTYFFLYWQCSLGLRGICAPSVDIQRHIATKEFCPVLVRIQSETKLEGTVLCFFIFREDGYDSVSWYDPSINHSLPRVNQPISQGQSAFGHTVSPIHEFLDLSAEPQAS